MAKRNLLLIIKNMIKKLVFGTVMLLSCTSAMCQTKQVVTIGGETVGKNIVSMTFIGDNVNVLYDDNSSENVDMSQLSIAFSNTATSISDVEKAKSTDNTTKTYSLNGQKVNDSYKGVVIKSGKKEIRK